MLLVWLTLWLPNLCLSVTEPMGLLGSLANILFPGGVYLLLLALTPRVGRATLWCFPLMFFAAFQLVLLDLFGRSVIATDMFLNLVTTNPSEAGELLAGLGWVVGLVIVVYLIDIAGGIVACVRKARLPRPFLTRCRHASCWLMATGVATLAGAVALDSSYSLADDLYPVNVARNIAKAVEVTGNLRHYRETSAGFTYQAASERPDSLQELYVLVVGETSRAADWELFGYDRPTNPRLSRRERLVGFPNAFSESNTTHKSVPMLLSPVHSENYDSLKYVRSIITAFREAGYHTAVISAQKPNHSYIEFFCAEADTTDYLPLSGSGKGLSDLDLLPRVADRMSLRAPRQLIVVHAYGSHFDYRDRYPASEARFRPDGPCSAKPENRDMLVNAYDNTICLTDMLVDSIASMMEQSGVAGAMVYTSDHGEDIFDDGRGLFLHASPIPSVLQVHVPMLVWVTSAYDSLYPAMRRNAVANSRRLVSTSGSYFHTALDLAGIHTPLFDPTLSLVSPAFAQRPLRYVTDRNTPVSLPAFLRRYGEPLPHSMQ